MSCSMLAFFSLLSEWREVALGRWVYMSLVPQGLYERTCSVAHAAQAASEKV